MAVTITQIAKRIGVSPGAVSKALNNKKDISPAMRKRIQQTASQMGYSVNIAARALVSKRTMTVGVVIPFPELETGMSRLQGIQNKCDEKGYLTACTFHNGNADDENKRLNYLKGRVDGIIMTPSGNNSELSDLIEGLSVPVIFMSETVPEIDIDFVSDDDEEGGYLAALHLLNEKQTNFAYFANNANIYSDQCIIRGIQRACEKQKLNFNDIEIYWENASKEKAESNIRQLIENRPDISGIFCFSDVSALWVMEKIIAMGKSIPDDFRIVGYDDIKFSTMAKVSLTSVSQPSMEIGFQAATLLLERIAEKKKSKMPRKIIFAPKLIKRQSSK